MLWSKVKQEKEAGGVEMELKIRWLGKALPGRRYLNKDLKKVRKGNHKDV